MVFVFKLIGMFVINPIAAAGFLHFSGLPIHSTFGIVLLGTFINMGILYFGVGSIIGRLTGFIGKIIAKLMRRIRARFMKESQVDEARTNVPKDGLFAKVGRKKILATEWLARRHVAIICTVLMIPVPYIPSIAIVATKLKDLEGRKKVAMLVITNLLRTIIVVLAIYYFPILLPWQKQ